MPAVTVSNQGNMQRDWRNPQWLEERTSNNWWSDVEGSQSRQPQPYEMDPKSASRLRWEKEKELNDLIAKGLKNLSALRQPEPRGNAQPPPEPVLRNRHPRFLKREYSAENSKQYSK